MEDDAEGTGVRTKSRVVAAAWAHQQTAGLGSGGGGEEQPFLHQPPTTWRSPGTHTDTDMPPLV